MQGKASQAGQSSTEPYLSDSYEVAQELLALSLCALGNRGELAEERAPDSVAGADELPLSSEQRIWEEFEALRKGGPADASAERVEEFHVFGEHSVAALVRTRRLGGMARRLRQVRMAVRSQQILAFQPLEQWRWLQERFAEGSAASARHPLVAFVLVKLRDDLMLRESFLFPPGFAECALLRAAADSRGAVHVEPWLAVGPADVLFIVSGSSLNQISAAIHAIRHVHLGDIAGAAPRLDGASTSSAPDLAAGPFLAELRRRVGFEPSERLETWFEVARDQGEPLPSWPSPEAFVHQLRVVSGIHAVFGVRREVVQGLAAHCRTVSGQLDDRLVPDADPASRLTELCSGSFARFDLDPAFQELLHEGGTAPGPLYPIGINLRIRVGRDHAAERLVRTLREQAIQRYGDGAGAAIETRACHGRHDMMLLTPETPIRMAGLVALLVVLEHACAVDWYLKRRLRHLILGIHSSFATGMSAESPDAGDLPEWQEFTEREHEERRAPSQPTPPRDRSKGAPPSLRSRLFKYLPMRLGDLQIGSRDLEKLEDTAKWLPEHVRHAVQRLINVFHAGLQDPVTGVYLLDLLPSIRTLVQLLNSAEVTSQAGTNQEWFTWQPLPHLHGGAATRVELSESEAVRRLVNVVRYLDSGLRQRIQHELIPPTGEASIVSAGRRQKQLSGIAALIPAFYEAVMPHPDLFRWPGFCLLELIEEPQIVQRHFAIIQVGPEILERPEHLIALFQEIGHLALISPLHGEAAREMREAIDAHMKSQDADVMERSASALNQLLEELFCDLALAFLAFDGDLDEYGRYMMSSLPSLAPNAAHRHRISIWRRVFIVSVLLDADGRRRRRVEVDERGQQNRGLDAVLELAVERFKRDARQWLSSEDPWLAGSRLLDSDELWPSIRFHARDVIEILTPERLRRFYLGERTVEGLLRNRIRRVRESVGAEPGVRTAPERRTVRVRNLHWRERARRPWLGLRSSSPALSSLSFPLVLPASLAGWCADARTLLRAEAVSDAERVALLQSLWHASQGQKNLLVDKLRKEHLSRGSGHEDTVDEHLLQLVDVRVKEDAS